MMKRMTIIDVMNDGGLCVPPIQRDYVMGRPEQDVEKKLGDSLSYYFNAIFNGTPDPLYFVYGISRGDAKDSPLMLLDGQQRLTTLLLLVWFCDNACSVVGKWTVTYSMRRSADYFMRHLFKTPCRNHDNPWSDIINSSWFLPEMEQDATVSGVHRVLDEIGKLYQAQNWPDIPSLSELERRLKGVSFLLENMNLLEDMKELKLTERTFDQIFLKMNARGLPLTKWEIMKSVLDKKNEDKNWEKYIDGEWANSIWDEIADGESANLDSAMCKIVRMAIRRQTWRLKNDECLPRWLCELGDIDTERSAPNTIKPDNFWKDCQNYFIHVAAKGFSKLWSCARSENSLWNEDGQSVNDAEFKDFMRCGNFNSCQLLRFDIVCSGVFSNATPRVKRVCLNLIDSLDNIDDTAAQKIYKMLEKYLSGGSLTGIKDELESSVSSYWKDCLLGQIQQEIIKGSLPENEVREVESSPLVHHAQIGFLMWGDAPTQEGVLISRLRQVEKVIRDDWKSFYCDLLARIPCVDEDPNHPCLTQIRVPYAEDYVWGKDILNVCELAKACVLYFNKKCTASYPAWLSHLNELLREGKYKYGSVKRDPYSGWMYFNPGEKRIVDRSFRLDYSEIEKKHRKSLLVDDHIQKSDCRWDGKKRGELLGKGRIDFSNKNVYYDVNAASWYETDGDLQPVRTEAKPLDAPSQVDI